MYGIGVFFALLAAIKAFRPGVDLSITAPLTPERMLMILYGNRLVELKGLGMENPQAVSRR